MEKPLLFLLFLCVCTTTAQVKIGENPNALDAASILELESSSKAIIITRVTTAEMNAINPLQGAMVYNEEQSCIFYYDGTVWNSLCEGGSGGIGSWGDITGNLADQTDLVAEFENYIDLSTSQSAAGEKTFTEKLTVNTGNINDQAAEFLGRVKGEVGVAPDDFVTKSQLDAVAAGGHTGSEGSIFFAGTDNAPTENNNELFWDDSSQRLGIGTNAPNSSLHTTGSFATNIRFGSGSLTLEITDHTMILNGDSNITLPPADESKGRIYILKRRSSASVVNISNYINSGGNQVSTLEDNIIWLQSDGFDWQQVN